MQFEVLVNDKFLNIIENNDLEPIDNKHILSLVNDFESGEWRYKKFQGFIWDNIAETALSFEERNALINKSHSQLTECAHNLRLTDKEKDISKGSELAEIILYGIMKDYYSALPVVPKIFYKQNAQDNAKGADSVHIVIEPDGDFSLWFGEAKFYNSIEDERLSTIVTSVANSLKTDKLKKENSIITNIKDLESLINDDDLYKKIKNALSNRTSIDNIIDKIHIPIFLLYECNETNSIDSLSDEYKASIIKYHKERAYSYFKKQIKKMSSMHNYSKISFHLILFPVPNKDKIIDKFVSNVAHYKEQ